LTVGPPSVDFASAGATEKAAKLERER